MTGYHFYLHSPMALRISISDVDLKWQCWKTIERRK